MVLSRRWLRAGGLALAGAGLLIALGTAPEMVARQPAAPARAAVVAGLVAFATLWPWLWLAGLTSAVVNPALTALTLLLIALTLVAPPGRDGLVLAALALGSGLRQSWAIPAVALLSGGSYWPG